jgi:hypothetical protein
MELAAQLLINRHNCSIVVEFSTVVGSTENSNQLSACKKLVTFFNYLMRSADHVNVMLCAKLLNDVLTEDKADTSVVWGPTVYLIRICPQKIAQDTFVRDVCWSVYAVDLLHNIDLGRQTSMHTENSLVNNSCYWEIVKHGAKLSPHRKIVSPLALIVETIHPCDGVALVVASEQEDHVWVLHFVRQQDANGFDALLSSIHEVSDQQKLVRWRSSSTFLKQTEYIIELTMEVSGDLKGSLYLQERVLLLENLSCLLDQPLDSLIRQVDKGSDFESAGLV